MAKFKKAGRKTAGAGSARTGAQSQAEQLSNKLGESAQQVWLAGVGAFGRAQAEGTKLFETLVKEGMNFEQTARRFAGGRADTVRDAVESKVGQARERASDTWDRLEKVFEDRVQRALVKLGVPGRDDLADLARRVDTLTGELRRQGGKTPTAAPRARKSANPPAKKTPVRKTAKAPRKAPAAKRTRRATKANTES
jgi:poly(hydroxyalkanoate) granule-associated protein